MHRLSWPNRVTLVRITLIVPFILLYLDFGRSPEPWKRLTLLITFAFIAVTDMLDGYLARRLKQVTLLGRVLDPLADKLLVLSTMVLLVLRGVPPDPDHLGAQPLLLPAWVLGAALAKDVVVVLGCYLVYLRTGQLVINPRLTGKTCTFFQMLMVVVLLAWPDLPAALNLPRLAWTIAGAFAIIAIIDYTILWRRTYRRQGASARHSATP